jgi:polysaccharide export outer membrane protein
MEGFESKNRNLCSSNDEGELMKPLSNFKITQRLFITVWVPLIILSIGCQEVQQVVRPTETQPEFSLKLVLGPGDVVDFKFFYVPELNDSQTVRPDGNISLQLIGELPAQGKTPDELRSELIKLYTPMIRQPEVAVIIRSMSNRRVYVGGEVNKPGMIPMSGKLTVLEAIMEAGGFKIETANVKNVVIIRQKEGKFFGSLINFRDTLNGKASTSTGKDKETQQSYLEPRDIVFVPQTTIVKVDQWVDQYIYKLLPVSRVGLGVSYTP